MDRQVNVLREDFRGLARDAEAAKLAMAGFGISDSAIAKQTALNAEMRKTRDLALEIRAASGGGGVGGSGGGFTGVFGGGGRDTQGLARAAESQFRRDLSTGGIIGGLFGAQEARRLAQSGISAEASLIPSGDLRGETNRLESSIIRDAFRARAAANASSGGGRGSDGVNRGALFGLLPGGARPSQAALTTLLGLAVGGAPAIAPGILAAAPLAGAGVTGLLGAAGTLKLAFDGITSAAFTTQAAFDKLTPVQQQFVQTLRSLDAGLGAELKGIAQNTLLPQLSAALHTAFTPGLNSALAGGVGAFSSSIGGGAQQFAGLLGGTGKGFGAFPSQLGQMLQQDAGYLRQFFTVLTNLTDAFVHFQVAAGPFLKWFGDLNVQFSQYVDNAIQADQANGRLAHFFDIVQTSLQTTGHLLASVGHLASAFVDAIGFQNSVSLVNLLSKAINDLANFLKANSHTFQDFFKGAVGAANDTLTAINGILHVLTPLLSLLDSVAKAFGGWKDIIDALIALRVATWVSGIGVAAAQSIVQVGLLRGALLGLGGPQVIAALAGIAAFFGGKALGNALAGGGSNGQFPLSSPTATVNGSQVDLSFPQGDPRANKSILYDTATGLFSQSVLKNGKDVLSKISLAQAAADIGTSQHKLLQAIGGPTNPTSSVASALGALAGTSNQGTGSSGSAGAHFGNLLQLPVGVRNALIAAQAGHGSLAAANAQAYSYYQGLLTNKNLPQSVINSIYGAEAPFAPSSAFGTPGALTPNTPTAFALPNSYQLAINKAATTKGTGDDKRAIQAALTYLRGVVKGLSPADQTTAYADIGSLQSQLASLNSPAGAAASGLGLLPQGLHERLNAAQTRLSGLGGVSASTPFSSGTEQAAIGVSTQLQASVNSINSQLDKQGLTKKQINALDAERLTLTKELAAAEKQVGDQILAQHKAQVAALEAAKENRILSILGIGGNLPSGHAAAANETSQVRSFLNTTLKSFGLGGTGSHPLQPFVQELYKAGDINKRQYESLEKILSAIEIMKTDTGKISSAATGNISQRLAEIKQELTPSTGFSDQNAVASAASILRKTGAHIRGTVAQRGRAFEDMNEELQRRGTLSHAGGSALGIPLTHGGRPALTSHHTIEVKVSAADGARLSAEAAEMIAQKVGKIFLGTRNRNSTQLTGRNAGRPVPGF